MQTFEAHEFVITDTAIEPTGVVETWFPGVNSGIEQIVESCLAARRETNPNWKKGPSGRTIYCGNKGWAVVPTKKN